MFLQFSGFTQFFLLLDLYDVRETCCQKSFGPANQNKAGCESCTAALTYRAGDVTLVLSVCTPAVFWVGPVCGPFPIHRPCWQLDRVLQTQHTSLTRAPSSLTAETFNTILSIYIEIQIIVLSDVNQSYCVDAQSGRHCSRGRLLHWSEPLGQHPDWWRQMTSPSARHRTPAVWLCLHLKHTHSIL